MIGVYYYGMPARNRRKEYKENSYYHIYNRGVEKRTVFQDQQDYAVFLSYLKTYLLPKDEKSLQETLADSNSSSKEKDQAVKLLRLNNFSDTLELVAYCLMENHFHFLVKQTKPSTIDIFMNSFSTRYSGYFNKKYCRVGPLFQGVYKAVLVQSDEQLLYLSRYIHRNPINTSILTTPASQCQALRGYEYSSYRVYLGTQSVSWIKPDHILNYFSQQKIKTLRYERFVEDMGNDDEEIRLLEQLNVHEY